MQYAILPTYFQFAIGLLFERLIIIKKVLPIPILWSGVNAHACNPFMLLAAVGVSLFTDSVKF
jgi:hypothetical protein